MGENIFASWDIYLYLSIVGWKTFNENYEGEANDLSPSHVTTTLISV